MWEPIGKEQLSIMRALKHNSADLDWRGALTVLVGIPQPAGPEWVPVYRAVLQVLCKAAQYEEATKVWEQLPQRDIMSYNTMLNLCSRMRKTEEAQQLLSQMKAEGIEPTGITLVTMIKVFSEGGQWTHAVEAFEALKQADVEFSGELAYLWVMKACERGGQADKARAFFDELCAGRGIPDAKPQFMHWNVLLHANKEDPVRCRALFDEMRAKGFEPRVRDWRALLVSYRGSFQRTAETYEEMKRALGPQADEDLFEALLRCAYYAKTHEGIRWILEEMRSSGLNPEQPKLPALRRALGVAQNLLNQPPAYDAAPSTTRVQHQSAGHHGPTVAAPPPTGALPAGWGSAVDPSTGLPYFWRVDDPASTTTWQRPTA